MTGGFLRDDAGALLVSDSAAADALLASAAVTAVLGSVAAVTLAAANVNRRALYIYNDSTALLRIKLGPAASSTDFTILLGAASASGPGGYYELPLPLYTGIVTGIWETAVGSARITEGA